LKGKNQGDVVVGLKIKDQEVGHKTKGKETGQER